MIFSNAAQPFMESPTHSPGMHLSPALRFLTSHAWAIEPGVFDAMQGVLERHAAGIRQVQEPLAIVDDLAATDLEPAMEILGHTAVIPVRGVIARYASQVNGICQDQGRSADSLQADLAAAGADPRVRQVVLRIDSPGGTVAGTAETADAIRRLSAAGKPVTAYVDGMAASAAYWLASQADEIIASAPTAEIGSIGVITAYLDASAARDKQGVKVHVVRSVDLKAPGTANESLSPEQLASIKRLIGDLHGAFTDAVAAGRGLTEEALARVTTGELFVAEKAQALDLIDGVEAWPDLLARLDGMAAIEDRAKAALRPAAARSTTVTTAAASAANPEDHPMKITAAVLLALVAAHPDHTALISERAKAGDDEGQIRDAIAEKRISDLTAQLTTARSTIDQAQAALTAEQAAHAQTKAELAQAKADAKARAERFRRFGAGAAQDPGAEAPAANKQKQKVTRAEYEKNPQQYAEGLRLREIELVDG